MKLVAVLMLIVLIAAIPVCSSLTHSTGTSSGHHSSEADIGTHLDHMKTLSNAFLQFVALAMAGIVFVVVLSVLKLPALSLFRRYREFLSIPDSPQRSWLPISANAPPQIA